MKHFTTLILLIVPFLMFSQQKQETQFKKSKLGGIKSLYEFIGDLPADAKILSFEMVASNGSELGSIKGNNAEMDDKKINFLKSIKAGSSVYVELKHKDSAGRITSGSYHIKIVN